MSIDDELDPEPVMCPVCIGFGTINAEDPYDAARVNVCPECDGERWVEP